MKLKLNQSCWSYCDELKPIRCIIFIEYVLKILEIKIWQLKWKSSQYCVREIIVYSLNCIVLLFPCLVDGKWRIWGSWSSCSVTCGSGKRSRSRLCTNPAPSNGGRACSGLKGQDQHCSKSNCPGICLYWSQCHVDLCWYHFLLLIQSFFPFWKQYKLSHLSNITNNIDFKCDTHANKISSILVIHSICQGKSNQIKSNVNKIPYVLASEIYLHQLVLCLS